MKFGLFSRSTASSLVVLVLLSLSNIFAIVTLTQPNTILLNSYNMDKLLIETTKMIEDLIYSEREHEQQYFLTREPVHYESYLSAKNDFEICLNELSSIPLAPDRKIALEKIKTYHRNYQMLINSELQDINNNRSYDKNRYKTLKGKALDAILQEAEIMEDYSLEDVNHKTEMVNQARTSARRVAIFSLLMSFLGATLLSFFITRSITHPLMNLVRKIRAIQTGKFECDLAISSAPPEINELNEAYNIMCEKLTELNKLKNNFFSMISHEMRTPLTTVKEGTTLLLEGVGGSITEKQERLLTIINAENNRMTKLVNSILDLTKMKAGMMTYSFEQGSIAPLIDQVISEFALSAEVKKIHLEKQAPANLPRARMDGDRMHDVLLNLVGNAVKFTPEGGLVTIAACSVPGEIEVSVSDTGPGIHENNLATIFEEFTCYDQKRGTGLGLAIVKHIIEAHGGRVWAESKVGEGTCFYFTLKLE